MTAEELETTEEVDVLAALLEQEGWRAGRSKTVARRRKRRSCLDSCLTNFIEPGLRFFHKRR